MVAFQQIAMNIFQIAIRLITFGLAGLLGILGVLFVITEQGPWGILFALIMFGAATFILTIPRLQHKVRARIARQRRVWREPEKSKNLRLVTFAAQMIGILALASVTRLWATAFIAAIILVAGHMYANYHVHYKSIPFVRLLVFTLFHLVFLWMIIGIFIGQPYPQAQLAMLGMAVVSWELFSRLNLYSGLGLGLINIYVAATLSRDTLFGVFLLAFLSLILIFLWVAESEDGERDNPSVLKPISSQSIRSSQPRFVFLFSAAFLLITPLIYFFTPHFAGRPLIMPVSLRVPIRGGAQSEIVNPAVPLVQIQGWSNETSEYYYGFDSQLDLSYRGGLNDTVMMVVRSPAWSYWRSHAYDFYDGRTWTQTDVDQFLFVDQRGVCEQYVTSLVVMLRHLGIPSRLVSGFGSGRFNRVTGYYEVRANDAHAWVEVYFPEIGWVPFDPTPGWEGDPETGPVNRWVFSNWTEEIDLPAIDIGSAVVIGGTLIASIVKPLGILSLLGIAGAAVWGVDTMEVVEEEKNVGSSTRAVRSS